MSPEDEEIYEAFRHQMETAARAALVEGNTSAFKSASLVEGVLSRMRKERDEYKLLARADAE